LSSIATTSGYDYRHTSLNSRFYSGSRNGRRICLNVGITEEGLVERNETLSVVLVLRTTGRGVVTGNTAATVVITNDGG
jgi:hypothetical protein